MEKPWILEVPILKTLSITLLLIHCIGIPLIFCLASYPNFFVNTDFIKLVFITTSFGAIFTCCAFFLLFLKETVVNRFGAYDIKLYETILLEILICYFIADIVAICFYLIMGNIIALDFFILAFGGGLVTIYLNTLTHKKETSANPVDNEQ